MLCIGSQLRAAAALTCSARSYILSLSNGERKIQHDVLEYPLPHHGTKIERTIDAFKSPMFFSQQADTRFQEGQVRLEACDAIEH